MKTYLTGLLLCLLWAGAAYAEEACLSCHADGKPGLVVNRHASKGVACSTCHGRAEGHQEDPATRDFVDFKDRKQVGAINAACLSCHTNSEKMMNWDGSEHQSAEVPCTSCHVVHSEKPDKVGSERCFTCHKDVRRDTGKMSHHPIREGQLECSSCHDVHGSLAPSLLTKNTVNELCVSCHVEKRGPFRFAHAPVEENCLTCHSAHGASAPRLLTQNLRNTCTGCHVFGRKRSLGDGELSSRSPGMMSRGSCVNCHGDIHGSNTDYHFR